MRFQVPLKERPGRALEERLVVRFPHLYAVLARYISRLAPRSRLRQAFLRRGIGLALAAVNRRDFEPVLPMYDPEVEFIPARELVGLGIGDDYRGREGFVRMWDNWDSGWATHVQYQEGPEIIDLGDRLVGRLRMRGVGEASGVDVEMDATFVWTLRDGLVIKEEHHAGAAMESVLERLGWMPTADR